MASLAAMDNNDRNNNTQSNMDDHTPNNMDENTPSIINGIDGIDGKIKEWINKFEYLKSLEADFDKFNAKHKVITKVSNIDYLAIGYHRDMFFRRVDQYTQEILSEMSNLKENISKHEAILLILRWGECEYKIKESDISEILKNYRKKMKYSKLKSGGGGTISKIMDYSSEKESKFSELENNMDVLIKKITSLKWLLNHYVHETIRVVNEVGKYERHSFKKKGVLKKWNNQRKNVDKTINFLKTSSISILTDLEGMKEFIIDTRRIISKMGEERYIGEVKKGLEECENRYNLIKNMDWIDIEISKINEYLNNIENNMGKLREDEQNIRQYITHLIDAPDGASIDLGILSNLRSDIQNEVQRQAHLFSLLTRRRRSQTDRLRGNTFERLITNLKENKSISNSLELQNRIKDCIRLKRDRSNLKVFSDIFMNYRMGVGGSKRRKKRTRKRTRKIRHSKVKNK